MHSRAGPMAEISYPHPDSLREIADHIDTLRRVILPTWLAATDDPHADEVVEALRDQAMQNDLRSWADYIEGLIHGV